MTWYVEIWVYDASCDVRYESYNDNGCVENTNTKRSTVRCDGWGEYCGLGDYVCAVEKCKANKPAGYDTVEQDGIEVWAKGAITTDDTKCGIAYKDTEWKDVGNCSSGTQNRSR